MYAIVRSAVRGRGRIIIADARAANHAPTGMPPALVSSKVPHTRGTMIPTDRRIRDGPAACDERNASTLDSLRSPAPPVKLN